MDITCLNKLCVAGSGTMGRQIALCAAIHGIDTYLYDVSAAALENADSWVNEYLAGRVAKGRMTQEQTDAARAKMHIEPSLEAAVKDAQLVIEAIIERQDIKESFFREVSELVAEDTVLATNSSYLVSSLFRDAVKNPGRLANLHFFHPALVMRLTEVVSGEHTSKETVAFLEEFSKKIGKTPVHVEKEVDGFVVNRILRALKEEAFWLAENKVCDPQMIDIAVEMGLNHPMGPFKLTDMSGIDITYYQQDKRYQATGEKPKGYDLIREKFEANELGRKTGRGFYDYTEKK